MEDRKIAFSGIDGATGRYLTEPMTPAELKQWAEGIWPPEPPPPAEKPEKKKDPFRKSMADIKDSWNLAETGWGVVFAPGIDRRVRLALEELLEYRRREAIRENSEYFRELEYRPKESVITFLKRNGAPAGIADADRLPYYLLLVGDPESIPYRFQTELDLHYGVGRLYFDDFADYRRYAENVVAAESGGRVRLPRRLTFFGPRNAGDSATEETADALIAPLAKAVPDRDIAWEIRTILGEDAHRDQLARLLGGGETPGLLFAACHGVGFPWGDERQLKRQGALVCQDWPGPNDETGIQRSHYFAAEDLPKDASLRGLIAFLYACHSLGTPSRDTVPQDNPGRPEKIANQSFVSPLPQRLLAHPGGGALAVIGHVDRALTASFLGSLAGETLDPYRNCLRRLLKGHTVSFALEFLNQAYAAYAAQHAGNAEARTRRDQVDDDEFLDAWRRKNDMQNFAVFGDPAVRLLGGRV